MLVRFTCISCDVDFEEYVSGVYDIDDVTDEMIPSCEECDCEDDVIVAETQPGDDEEDEDSYDDRMNEESDLDFGDEDDD